MATFNDYGGLKTFIAGIGHRADLTDDIPGFIANAEGMIARKARATEMRTVTTLNEDDRFDGAVYNLPTDFLGVIALRTGDRKLVKTGLTQLSGYSLAGSPRVYSIYGLQAEFRGSPQLNTEFELIYYARLANFTNDTDTNTLLTNHPDLYIHATMHWFHLHTQDLELASGHRVAFDETITELNAMASRTRGSGAVANGYNFDRGSTM